MKQGLYDLKADVFIFYVILWTIKKAPPVLIDRAFP